MQATSQWCFSQTKSEVALRGGPRLSPGPAVPRKRRSHKDRWKEVAHERKNRRGRHLGSGVEPSLKNDEPHQRWMKATEQGS